MSKYHAAPRSKGTSGSLMAAVCLAPLILAGCAAFPTMTTTTRMPDRAEDARAGDDAGPTGSDATVAGERRPSERLSIPTRAAQTPQRPAATEAEIAALLPDEPVDATLAPQSIPQFAATVFGGVLNLPYSLSGDVATRTEVIAGGTGGTISKRALFRLTQQALKQYGIDVYIDGGAVTVGSSQTGAIGSEIVRNRSTPASSGRVVQFFNVQTIEVNVLQSLLGDLFPNLGGARVTPDPLTNSLIISGTARDVQQVVRTLREIDQPRFAGADVLRVEPVYWAADALATSLEQTLTTEGYIVSRQALAGRSIVILSFPQANQILVFAKDPELLDRVNYWVGMLDRPAALGDKATTFVYNVRNTDAQSLGQLAMGQAPTTSQPQPPVGVPGTPAVTLGDGPSNQGSQTSSSRSGGQQQGASGTFLGGRLLTDPIGNRIIFTGTAGDYAQLRTLLSTLDTPAPQVVIEVMIAEVTLTDGTDIGVNLFGTETRGDGVLTGSSEGLTLKGAAGVFNFIGPDFRARIVASASNNRVSILQRPQLVTRSGGTARFQVGTDVPIISSQRASNSNSNGDTDILQSVQYRQTGTILEITPVVYGDRVDISISQELSSAGAPPAGTSISSPTILNRSLTTQIAIKDGWTGVLGGLIGNNYTKANTGIPFLKDVPIIGSAFQSNSISGERTELLLLITPYIVRGDDDMADFAEEYAGNMNAAFRTGRGWSYTLTPWSISPRFRGLGVDLPSPLPASETPSLLPARGRPAAAVAAPGIEVEAAAPGAVATSASAPTEAP
jgi:general secretion pathway protein D